MKHFEEKKKFNVTNNAEMVIGVCWTPTKYPKEIVGDKDTRAKCNPAVKKTVAQRFLFLVFLLDLLAKV